MKEDTPSDKDMVEIPDSLMAQAKTTSNPKRKEFLERVIEKAKHISNPQLELKEEIHNRTKKPSVPLYLKISMVLWPLLSVISAYSTKSFVSPSDKIYILYWNYYDYMDNYDLFCISIVFLFIYMPLASFLFFKGIFRNLKINPPKTWSAKLVMLLLAPLGLIYAFALINFEYKSILTLI